MHVRITKLRVAMAALFVLAGIGLGNLLSPLVGTALATVGQTREHLRSLGFGLLREGRLDREARRRRRRRTADRGRNGLGSSSRASFAVARTSGDSVDHRRSVHCRAERVADQPQQPPNGRGGREGYWRYSLDAGDCHPLVTTGDELEKRPSLARTRR
jgi:hypothetical protein